jgi:hypothetical protein
MSVGVMKDYELHLRNLHVSHTVSELTSVELTWNMKTSAGSFETPSCFRDVYTLHQLCPKEGRNSHVTQDHIGVCHMKTNMNKKASEHMNFRAHTRNTSISTDKSTLSVQQHLQEHTCTQA